MPLFERRLSATSSPASKPFPSGLIMPGFNEMLPEFELFFSAHILEREKKKLLGREGNKEKRPKKRGGERAAV